MIIVRHKNKEIESLVLTGKSMLYKELSRKKAFLNVLRSFYSILEVIDDVRDLMVYTYLQYSRKELSCVLIAGAGISKKLVFSEHDNGKSILILDLI